jgi:hypothetical protein
MRELAPKGSPLSYTDSKKGVHSQWSFLNGDNIITVKEIVPIEDGEFTDVKPETKEIHE